MISVVTWIVGVLLVAKSSAISIRSWQDLKSEGHDLDSNRRRSFVLDLEGFDINSVVSNYNDVELLKRATMRYGVVILRNQTNVEVSTLRMLGTQFGQLQKHVESYSWHPVYDDVNIISNIKDTKGNLIGLNGNDVEQFHSDLAWSSSPADFTMLMGLILPSQFGNTIFADATTAYETLNPSIRAAVTNMIGVYSYSKHHPMSNGTKGPVEPEVLHPLILTHPRTGSKSIYASAADTINIVGLDERDSQDLLDILMKEVVKTDNIYEHAWLPGDILLWDNRVIQHKAGGCPSAFPRKMVRLTISDVLPTFIR